MYAVYFMSSLNPYQITTSQTTSTYSSTPPSPDSNSATGSIKKTIVFSLPSPVTTWHLGEEETISWSASVFDLGPLTLELYKSNTKVMTISTNAVGGTYVFKVPDTLVEGNDYQIYAYENNNHSRWGISSYFKIRIPESDLSKDTAITSSPGFGVGIVLIGFVTLSVLYSNNRLNKRKRGE